MYVCVCRAVTERQVKQAAQEGAASLRDLRDRLGVTGDCGRCAKCALACLRAHAPARQEHSESPLFSLLPSAA